MGDSRVSSSRKVKSEGGWVDVRKMQEQKELRKCSKPVEGYWLTADRQLVSSFSEGLSLPAARSPCLRVEGDRVEGEKLWLLHVLPHTTSPHLPPAQPNSPRIHHHQAFCGILHHIRTLRRRRWQAFRFCMNSLLDRWWTIFPEFQDNISPGVVVVVVEGYYNNNNNIEAASAQCIAKNHQVWSFSP